MAAYFNLNNSEISKELLVSKFNMILDNQRRLMLNESQKSPGFVQKQPPGVFYKKRCS